MSPEQKSVYDRERYANPDVKARVVESTRARRRTPEGRLKRNAAERAHHAAHKDQLNAAQRERRKAPHIKAARQAEAVKRRYGLSHDSLDARLVEQLGACELCHAFFGPDLPFVVDHDHATGRVRALLCHACNVALGHVEKRSPEWLDRANRYLGRKTAP